jgi:hypothetical protein
MHVCFMVAVAWAMEAASTNPAMYAPQNIRLVESGGLVQKYSIRFAVAVSSSATAAPLVIISASVAEMTKQMKRSEEAVRSRAYRLKILVAKSRKLRLKAKGK